MFSRRAPLSRPSYNQGYIPIGNDGYNNQLYRVGGYTINTVYPNPCSCCSGFGSAMQCQYGKPCSRNVCANKPDFISFH